MFVHGSVVGAATTWAAQRPLAERFELVAVERPGFLPGSPVERVDFEADAGLVAGLLHEGDHLVGHSYGGVIALLAAAREPAAIRSLTVIEPPATRVARGVPTVDEFAARGEELYAEARAEDPEVFLRRFLAAVGSALDPPSPLPPELERGAHLLTVERGPWEAEIPLDTLRAAPFARLVVSGGHHPAFDAICDALERELAAERAVLQGFGHTVARHPEFNAVLTEFVERSTRTSG